MATSLIQSYVLTFYGDTAKALCTLTRDNMIVRITTMLENSIRDPKSSGLFETQNLSMSSSPKLKL